MDFLIVTGLSGAGKSLAVHALEDIGFFCIDNIPARLLASFAQAALQKEMQLGRVAMVLDSRGSRSADALQEALEELQEPELKFRVLFLDASDEVLERRYRETRRRHPLCQQMDCSTAEAIREERSVMAPMFERADYIVDTSLLSTAQLRGRIVDLFTEHGQAPMVLTLMSFGFKYGQPKEADVVFDVRCVPNPYYIPELRLKTGLDDDVVEYVMQFDASQGLLERLQVLLNYALPLYVKEGKSQLTVAVGCTGGKHRSVTFARKLAEYCEALGYRPNIQHRDVTRHS